MSACLEASCIIIDVSQILDEDKHIDIDHDTDDDDTDQLWMLAICIESIQKFLMIDSIGLWDNVLL